MIEKMYLKPLCDSEDQKEHSGFNFLIEEKTNVKFRASFAYI